MIFFFFQMGTFDIQLDRTTARGSSVGNGARFPPDRGCVHGRRIGRYVHDLKSFADILKKKNQFFKKK